MNKALIVIDYTNDFIADNGKLTCGKSGQKIEKNIEQRIKDFLTNPINDCDAGDNFVIFVNDLHKKNENNHPENKLFPTHNIEGTEGRKLYGRVGKLYDEIKDKENVIYLDKIRYSAFAGTNLEIILRQNKIQEIELCGVCTDICVLHTAVDAYNKGFYAQINSNCVASFNQIGHEWAINHFKNTLGFGIKK
ncbi:MAG: cysteine hydrolase family protein [archaeon]